MHLVNHTATTISTTMLFVESAHQSFSSFSLQFQHGGHKVLGDSDQSPDCREGQRLCVGDSHVCLPLRLSTHVCYAQQSYCGTQGAVQYKHSDE